METRDVWEREKDLSSIPILTAFFLFFFSKKSLFHHVAVFHTHTHIYRFTTDPSYIPSINKVELNLTVKFGALSICFLFLYIPLLFSLSPSLTLWCLLVCLFFAGSDTLIYHEKAKLYIFKSIFTADFQPYQPNNNNISFSIASLKGKYSNFSSQSDDSHTVELALAPPLKEEWWLRSAHRLCCILRMWEHTRVDNSLCVCTSIQFGCVVQLVYVCVCVFARCVQCAIHSFTIQHQKNDLCRQSVQNIFNETPWIKEKNQNL